MRDWRLTLTLNLIYFVDEWKKEMKERMREIIIIIIFFCQKVR